MTDTDTTLITEIVQGLDANDDGYVVACPSRDAAATLTNDLYDNTNPSETYHVEHYPVTNDETGTVDYIALVIRRLHYDRDNGWFSTDVEPTPDMDLRENGTHTYEDKRRYAVTAETVQDPYHNYTVLGRIITVDRTEYNSDHDAAMYAAEQATAEMPESLDDILDHELHVFEITNDSICLSVDTVHPAP